MVGILSRGTYVEPHACVASAQLRLVYDDGQETRLGLYTGHESMHLEFSLDGRAYSVSRTQFLDAALGAGFPTEGLSVLREWAGAAPRETAVP